MLCHAHTDLNSTFYRPKKTEEGTEDESADETEGLDLRCHFLRWLLKHDTLLLEHESAKAGPNEAQTGDDQARFPLQHRPCHRARLRLTVAKTRSSKILV